MPRGRRPVIVVEFFVRFVFKRQEGTERERRARSSVLRSRGSGARNRAERIASSVDGHVEFGQATAAASVCSVFLFRMTPRPANFAASRLNPLRQRGTQVGRTRPPRARAIERQQEKHFQRRTCQTATTMERLPPTFFSTPAAMPLQQRRRRRGPSTRPRAPRAPASAVAASTRGDCGSRRAEYRRALGGGDGARSLLDLQKEAALFLFICLFQRCDILGLHFRSEGKKKRKPAQQQKCRVAASTPWCEQPRSCCATARPSRSRQWPRLPSP